MIFCPTCKNRAVPNSKSDPNTKYHCSRINCDQKEFKPKP